MCATVLMKDLNLVILIPKASADVVKVLEYEESVG